MAEVNVEKKRSGETERQRHGESGLARRNETYPSIFTQHPFELLTMSPFMLMRRLTEEMDRFGGGTGAGWTPSLDISERDGKMIVHADLPGLDKDDVHVEAREDSLIIEGERKRESDQEEKGFRRIERTYGKFYRRIPLPEGADVDQAKAQFNNGVLEISIPVPEQQQNGRLIPIEAGGVDRKDAASQSSRHKTESKAG
jgi:HSP20 family protein